MKTCPVCEKVLTDQAKFCYYCGASLLNVDPSAAPAAEAESLPETDPDQEIVIVPESEPEPVIEPEPEAEE